ncbi:hypothetical protein [Deinococcus hopiensis]|nr:hypothetical protein [Deinococcus hopiensis]
MRDTPAQCRRAQGALDRILTELGAEEAPGAHKSTFVLMAFTGNPHET